MAQALKDADTATAQAVALKRQTEYFQMDAHDSPRDANNPVDVWGPGRAEREPELEIQT